MEGKKGKSLTNLKQYKKSLEGLYEQDEIRLPYYTPKTTEDIATIGEDINYSEVDSIAQNQISRESETKENKNEVV